MRLPLPPRMRARARASYCACLRACVALPACLRSACVLVCCAQVQSTPNLGLIIYLYICGLQELYLNGRTSRCAAIPRATHALPTACTC